MMPKFFGQICVFAFWVMMGTPVAARWIDADGCSVWSGSSDTVIVDSKWSGSCGQSPTTPEIKNARIGSGEVWEILKKGSVLRISNVKHSNYSYGDNIIISGFSSVATTNANPIPKFEEFNRCAYVEKIVGGVQFTPVSCSMAPPGFWERARRFYEGEWRQKVAALQQPPSGNSPGAGVAPQADVEKNSRPSDTAGTNSEQNNADCLKTITRIHLEVGTRMSSARTPTERAQIQLETHAIPQKQLFEGRCATHPQAAAYINTANRLISEAEQTLGSAATAAATAATIPKQLTQQPEADSNRSKIIASDGRSAKDCVELKELSRRDSKLGTGGRILANNCGETVEIFWCYVDTECSKELGNQWNVGAGRSWPVSATREIRWNACYGPNTISAVKGTAGTRHYCRSPIK